MKSHFVEVFCIFVGGDRG